MTNADIRNLSYYRLLKKTNPEKYHQLNTYRDMYYNHRKIGIKFFDLMQENV